ncbi:hypothetical protein JCM11491_002496 [Sporobolomyces phaffii]
MSVTRCGLLDHAPSTSTTPHASTSASSPVLPPYDLAHPPQDPLPPQTTTMMMAVESSPTRVPPPAHLAPSPSPPPYEPSLLTSITSLSFYPLERDRAPPTSLPFSSLTPVESTFPPFSPRSPPQPSDASGSTVVVPPPPSYSQVPQTRAERWFVYGFLCPFLWIAGVAHYWYPEQALESLSSIDKYLDDEEGAGGRDERVRIEESLARWRDEEVLWSLRCAYCLGGFVSVAVLGGIVIAAVMGKL